MYCIIGFLRKPAGMDSEAFRDWWFNRHVPHVLKIPGVRKYSIFPIDGGLADGRRRFRRSVRGRRSGAGMLRQQGRRHRRDNGERGQEDMQHIQKWAIEVEAYGAEMIVHRDEPAC